VDSILDFEHVFTNHSLTDHPTGKVVIHLNDFDCLAFYFFPELFPMEFLDLPRRQTRGDNADAVNVAALTAP
jgi:hypothetical protein